MRLSLSSSSSSQPPLQRLSTMMVTMLVSLIGCSLLTNNISTVQAFTSLQPSGLRIAPLLTPTRTPFSSAKINARWAPIPMNEKAQTESGGDDDEKRNIPFYKLPKAAYRIYTNYAKRLWKETDVPARKRIANDKVRGSIRAMQHILQSNEYAEFSDGCSTARANLLESCESMLEALPKKEPLSQKENIVKKEEPSSSTAAATTTTTTAAAPKKKTRSKMFGALMGATAAAWVFSGNYVFTGAFCLVTILGQLEYYRMIMNTGVYAARRISVIGASSMFLTALFAPELHQICLPIFGLWAMIWFLTMRQQFSTIPEIATTFTGMFYLGYVPSFWVRTRMIGAGMEPTRIFGLMAPFREYMKSTFGILVPDRLIVNPFTTGSVFIFWSWLSLAFSDVGAYFVGRKYGKTKLGEISSAAGATSPNKTVEGVIGGCAVSAAFSVLGAWVQNWPYFVLTGAVHGTILGLLGLIGDLTASMLKRDAGLKDFGDLIPEHGGILDRVDSFIWTAPYSWLVCAYIIPGLKAATLR